MLVYLAMIDEPRDRSKFETVYLTYRHVMYNAAYRILQNRMDAEDAVHQAFLKILENLEKISESIGLKTKAFVVIIVERKALDIYRARSRRREVPLDEQLTGLPVVELESDELAECIAQLPQQLREPLLLRFGRGYSVREVASSMGISENAVAKRLKRARDMLEKLCKEAGIL